MGGLVISDDSQRVYIKTEPGGRVVFGRLSATDTEALRESCRTRMLAQDLGELCFNWSGDFREYEGVFNYGVPGDKGNEGLIEWDGDGPIQLEADSEGNLIDGLYLVFLSLSKVSVEFEFFPGEKYNSDNFVETSVPVVLPTFIRHGLYGHPAFNVVVDFKYNGESIEEYDRELVDRGYSDHLFFVEVSRGSASVIYSRYDEEESWISSP